MTTLSVDGFTVAFPEGWSAAKLDDWTFYQRRFQGLTPGVKAVDVVAVDPARTLWFIEFKDYRVHPRTKPLDLCDELALKVRDALALLAAARCNANDPDEKRDAAQALKCKTMRVVLHLEQPQQHSKLFPRAINPANILQKLKQRLRSVDPHPLVVELAAMRSVSWTVQ